MAEKIEKIPLLLEGLSVLESYINDIFTFFPLPLCFISPKGVILESNPVFVKISNFTFDEVIGKAIEDLFGKKEGEKLSEDTLKKGFVEGREIKFFPKNRGELPVQVFTKTRKEEAGANVGYFLCLFDLTEIKKKEAELKKKIEELEEFHRFTVGRELKMIELKRKIQSLKDENN